MLQSSTAPCTSDTQQPSTPQKRRWLITATPAGRPPVHSEFSQPHWSTGRCRFRQPSAAVESSSRTLRPAARQTFSAPSAALEAMRGRFGEARRLVARARDLYRELGQVSTAEANCGAAAARIELEAGDYAAAEQILRSTCHALELAGDRAYLATAAAELANVLCHSGQFDEADEWCSLAAELGASDDIITQASWRTARARLLVQEGKLGEAEELAREAVRLMRGDRRTYCQGPLLARHGRDIAGRWEARRSRGSRGAGDRALRSEGERRRRASGLGVSSPRWPSPETRRAPQGSPCLDPGGCQARGPPPPLTGMRVMAHLLSEAHSTTGRSRRLNGRLRTR